MVQNCEEGVGYTLRQTALGTVIHEIEDGDRVPRTGAEEALEVFLFAQRKKQPFGNRTDNGEL